MAFVKTFAGGTLFASSSSSSLDVSRVVYLHGWRRDRTDFAAMVTDPGGVAIDLPGFGASPPPPAAWGAARYARLVGELLLELGAEKDPVVLVGHSFGGRVATCVAAQSPNLVRGLLLMGTPLLRSSPAGRPVRSLQLAKALRRRGLISESRVESLRHRHGSDDYRSANGVMRNVLVTVVNEDYADQLKAVHCPCAMLWGQSDTAAPIETARRAAGLVPNLVEFCEVDSGHDVHLSHPDEVRRLVESIEKASHV